MSCGQVGDHVMNQLEQWSRSRQQGTAQTPYQAALPATLADAYSIGLGSEMSAKAAHLEQQEQERLNTAAEYDPNGINQHAAGAKLDAGKPRAALVVGGFAKALMEVAKVGTFGANKYSADGWKGVENGEERYRDAGVRHFLYRMGGEEIDQDSGLLHLAHQAWNVLAELEFRLNTRGAHLDTLQQEESVE